MKPTRRDSRSPVSLRPPNHPPTDNNNCSGPALGDVATWLAAAGNGGDRYNTTTALPPTDGWRRGYGDGDGTILSRVLLARTVTSRSCGVARCTSSLFVRVRSIESALHTEEASTTSYCNSPSPSPSSTVQVQTTGQSSQCNVLQQLVTLFPGFRRTNA